MMDRVERGVAMGERVDVPEGAISWLDLWTSDVEGSRAFYAALFDWRAEAPSEEFGGYWMFTRRGAPIAGGMGDMDELRANDSWKVYLATPDAHETYARCERLGATGFAAPTAVADMGIQAVLSDVTGAAVGIWQPLGFLGFTTLDQHGSPCWFELHAREYDAAVAFYRDAFHLEATVMSEGEFAYTTLSAGGRDVAGVFDASGTLGEGESSHWVVYWQVDDVDGAVEHVRALGGTVLADPVDSPYGRIATVADPAGAVFKLRGGDSPA